MKVYMNNIDFSKLNIDYETIYNQNFIYSNEGIFGFKNNKLYKIDIVDSENEKIKFKNYEFLIDNSKMIMNDVVYHIPYDHIFCEETISKRNMGDSVILVKREYFDQISYYFEIEGKLESFMLNKMFTLVI